MLLTFTTFIILFTFSSPSLLVSSLNQEGLYLHQIKQSLGDPDNSLSTWNPRDDTPCSWHGITCTTTNTTTNNNNNNGSISVTSVDLSNFNLYGPFPSLLCRLRRLTYLSLLNNGFNSSLADTISTCQTLTHLILTDNYFMGPIPSTIPDISTLTHLDLAGNNFSGDIPATFGRFPALEVLSLVGNLLDGRLNPGLGNISTLKQLNLSYNPFAPSPIPPELGNLTNLEVLWLTDCNLVGEIPRSLGKLKKVVDFDLAVNNLHGSIDVVAELSSVVQVELYNNSFSGSLPIGLAKVATLRRLDVSMNELGGVIPEELCELPLESLNLYENQFVGTLPKSIAGSPNLYELRLFNNRLSGELPSDLGKNSPLQWVDVSENRFSGEIPKSLCEKGYLEELLLIYNSFSGGVPESLGHCQSLTRVRMRNNLLSGEIPAGLWGLPSLVLLEFVGNSFSGGISDKISGAYNLSGLLISGNRFTGSIPAEIGKLENLVEFSGNGNLLSGPLPGTIANLKMLGRLDLHGNHLSGELPVGMQAWKQLNELNLANNRFTGEIPSEIGSLPVLNYLDLSGNRLSGEIPMGLQDLRLNQLNLSDNQLTGEIPPMYAKETYKNSFLGNPGLCGDIEGLCSSGNDGKRGGSPWVLRSIFILAAVVLITGVVLFYCKYRSFYKAKKGIDKSKWTLTSFHKLGFSEYEILDCLDEDNVIGSGGSGKVYKAVLSNGETVAVKKLWGVSKKGDVMSGDDMEKGCQVPDDGFEAEVDTLGKIRHKNIVRLWCCCTTRDCKLLVYEYMPNGSLGDLLHSSKGGLLDWPMRYKIAVDAAEGLAYLHHDCAPSIVHRDVKSNNILLDGEFGARVADFGVAKVVDAIGKGHTSMSVIAGSCGYIAPEYAYTLRVNEKSDIYSFGVVLLELVTGRLPIDPEFGEKDLVKWVCATLDKKGVDHIIDPKLNVCFKEEICKVLNIGLVCTSPLPINRPSMRRVVKLLQELSMETKANVAKKDGKLSPYYYENASDQGSVV